MRSQAAALHCPQQVCSALAQVAKHSVDLAEVRGCQQARGWSRRHAAASTWLQAGRHGVACVVGHAGCVQRQDGRVVSLSGKLVVALTVPHHLQVVVEADLFPKALTCLKYPDEFVRKHAATLVSEHASAAGLGWSWSAPCRAMTHDPPAAAPTCHHPQRQRRRVPAHRCARCQSTRPSWRSSWSPMEGWAHWWSTQARARATTGQAQTSLLMRGRMWWRLRRPPWAASQPPGCRWTWG
jgi:hypothetical protein